MPLKIIPFREHNSEKGQKPPGEMLTVYRQHFIFAHFIINGALHNLSFRNASPFFYKLIRPDDIIPISLL